MWRKNGIKKKIESFLVHTTAPTTAAMAQISNKFKDTDEKLPVHTE